MGAGGFGVFGGGFRALLEFRFGGWRDVGLYCWIFGLGLVVFVVVCLLVLEVVFVALISLTSRIWWFR